MYISTRRSITSVFLIVFVCPVSLRYTWVRIYIFRKIGSRGGPIYARIEMRREMRQKGMRKDGGAECKGCEFVNSLMDKPRMKITASVYEYTYCVCKVRNDAM